MTKTIKAGEVYVGSRGLTTITIESVYSNQCTYIYEATDSRTNIVFNRTTMSNVSVDDVIKELNLLDYTLK